MTNRKLTLWVALLLLLAACKKEPTAPETLVPTARTSGVFVLNEGLFQRDNSTLTFYDLDSAKTYADYFSAVNGRTLGDTGNSLYVYDSTLFVVVSNSFKIEALNLYTGKSIGTISLPNREPRQIAVASLMQAYVTNLYTASVSVFNPTTLQLTGEIPVGQCPEGIAFQNGKIYVANSGGLNFPNYDSTVSIIDVRTNTVIKTITVGLNPIDMAADAYGNVYVVSVGGYNAAGVPVSPRLKIIDSRTDTVRYVFPFDVTGVSISSDNGFLNTPNAIAKIDVKADTVINATFIPKNGNNLLGMVEDVVTGNVFVTDAKNYQVSGNVLCYDSNGNFKFSFQAGIVPSGIAFRRSK
jgi:YVTN family beta-propeller protein